MSYESIGCELCSRLKNEFALLGAVKKNGDYNFMTVSWGSFGILWGKEVCTVFVRPERYTFEFCEEAEIFTLSFFDESRKKDLAYCGSVSGRDHDKARECGFETKISDGKITFKDAKLTLTLRKMYAQDICEECFLDKSALSFYKNSGFHRMYVCEVLE